MRRGVREDSTMTARMVMIAPNGNRRFGRGYIFGTVR
jgi:hypothetical protein